MLTLAACGEEASQETADVAAADSAPAAMETTVTPAAPAAGSFLDPNTAAAEELQTRARLQPAAASAIVAGRPYADNLALNRVLTQQNLTEAQKDSVFAYVWKPIDPNTASDEEIQLIPGVGERMAHEFEEYRPWTSVEQFRREIGKYVDEAEVERLLSFTTLK
ncbi:MAG: helix-hairpin-helix domain-containing protein [Gemmatimonadetes bacterium]|nr:helix-hairpin-helix domain-containing protein [Gemmatimonadota bacterium]